MSKIKCNDIDQGMTHKCSDWVQGWCHAEHVCEKQVTKRTWHFTVEKDIPIDAYTEEEAERKFYNKYGSRQILGIIRPMK